MKRLAVVMDPIATINYKKDSTLAMLWEAKARGYALFYIELKDLYLQDGIAYAEAYALDVFKDEKKYFALSDKKNYALTDFDIILMRKDPPVDDHYIYATYILEHAERLGVRVVNRPQALRDANEKLFATLFPQFMPPTLVTSTLTRLQDFWRAEKDIICKPLNSMGGDSVFRIQADDVNANVIFALLTKNGSTKVMAQRFIPAITAGDKRIVLINGEAYPHALTRVPQAGDWRGNLAAGAKGVARALTARDWEICAAIGPTLKERGLYFVGIDVIGDFLTEINVTSPTGIRELDAALHANISALLFDAVATIKR